MGEFRDRMEQDLQIRGFSPSTQYCYLARMKAMVRFFMRPPDELTLEDIHTYQLHLTLRVASQQQTHAIFRSCLCGESTWVGIDPFISISAR